MVSYSPRRGFGRHIGSREAPRAAQVLPFNHPGWYLATGGRREAVSKVEVERGMCQIFVPGLKGRNSGPQRPE